MASKFLPYTDINLQKVDSVKVQFAAVLLLFVFLDVLAIFVHSDNPRVSYAFSQMRLATLLTFATTLIVWSTAQFHLLERLARTFPRHGAAPYLIGLIVLFACFWAPVSAFSDFAQDDWLLLAAASIRTALVDHPYDAWLALDTVDGNFRPLSTNILFAESLHFFGLTAAPFLVLNFVANLLGLLLLFAIACELRLSRATAMLASVLYLSRGMLYGPIGWPCSFGDGFVILAMAAIVWLILRAQREDGSAIRFHLVAWCLFLCALFAKQSAFAIPAIVFLAILLSPGRETINYRSRIKWAALAFVAYLPPVSIVFFHAKALSHGVAPYPIGLNIISALHLFSYVTWYGFMLDFGKKFVMLNELPWLIGIAISALIAIALYRTPRLYVGRIRVLLYVALCSAASLALFAFLPNRTLGYYGAMAAFWASIAFATILTRWFETAETVRSRQIVMASVCAFVLLGWVNVRLAQTGLISSGSYIWGTFSGWHDREAFKDVSQILDQESPGVFDDVVFVAPREVALNLAAYALLHERPTVKRVLAYVPDSRTWLSNNREGLRPGAAVTDYTDVGAYRWDRELPADRAWEIMKGKVARWLFVREDGSLCAVQTSPPLDAVPAPCR